MGVERVLLVLAQRYQRAASIFLTTLTPAMVRVKEPLKVTPINTRRVYSGADCCRDATDCVETPRQLTQTSFNALSATTRDDDINYFLLSSIHSEYSHKTALVGLQRW